MRTLTAGPDAAAAARDDTLAVRRWLWGIVLLLLAMIMVGGGTRLTDSGLSITEWQPLLGAIPPLSEANWVLAFDRYKQIPEYHQVNKGMSLEAFKSIFWWEWGHRFLGRFIGAAFAVPLLIFWLRGRLPKGYGLPLVGIFLLGGLQGAVGWYMVSSGLVDRIDVSHYRLALHLSIAFLILALVTWTALSLSERAGRAPLLATTTRAQAGIAILLVVLFAAQLVMGAFVAGLKAGLTYNTWPLMDGRLVPNGLAIMAPWWMNLVENITAVQFSHRTLAYVIVALALWQAVSVWRTADGDDQRTSAALLALALVLQAVLGIWTLLEAGAGKIPLGLGVAHQGWAAVVLILAVWHLWSMTAARGQTRGV